MRRLMTLSLLGLAACASQYYYQPAEQATATVTGYPAARYGVPPEQPRGDVRVATLGIARIDMGGEEGVPSLHVRMVVSNDNGVGPWALDTREVLVQIAGMRPLAPAFVNASAAELPVVQIAPGERRTVDLFYPLPDEMSKASHLPALDVVWRVQTEAREVAERTPFERIRIEPTYDAALVYGYGFGVTPYWWYDPFYAYPYPRSVVVRRVRPPHVHYYGYPR